MDVSLATIVLWVLPVVFAITLHEAAHGYIAKLFGDQTAFMLGRVTLNPLKHIDPIGTIAVPGFLIAVSVLTKAPLFIFGWAKPVPVNFGNLRHPKRDMLWVAGAGDRKSTRLNSSHGSTSYAVFCLKKKSKQAAQRRPPSAPPSMTQRPQLSAPAPVPTPPA